MSNKHNKKQTLTAICQSCHCQISGLAKSEDDLLYKHAVKKHDGDFERCFGVVPTEDTRPAGNPAFVCETCGQDCHNKAGLKSHMRKHAVVSDAPMSEPEPVVEQSPVVEGEQFISLEDRIALYIKRSEAMDALVSKQAAEQNNLAVSDTAFVRAIKALEAVVERKKNVILPKLLELPEQYRNIDLINKLQEDIYVGTNLVVEGMLDTRFERGVECFEDLERKLTIQKAQDDLLAQNNQSISKASSEADSFVSKEMERFNNLLRGEQWIPSKSKLAIDGALPFAYDLWLEANTLAKFGLTDPKTKELIVDADGVAVLPAIENYTDRTTSAMEPYFVEAFERRMYRYGFDFSKNFHIEYRKYKLDSDNHIVVDGNAVKETRTVTLNHEAMLSSAMRACKAIHAQLWMKRNAKWTDVLSKLDYYGTQKLGTIPLSEVRGIPRRKVDITKLTNVGYAIMVAKGEITDNPDALQPK